MSAEESAQLARETKKLMDAIAELFLVPPEGTGSEVATTFWVDKGYDQRFIHHRTLGPPVTVLSEDAAEQLRGSVAEQAWAALAAADDWVHGTKRRLPADELPEWIHLHHVARVVPFAIRHIVTDLDAGVLADLHDLLRAALEGIDRVGAEELEN